MKKFSVLLVILLLATPLLAYGLTADVDEGGIALQTIFYSEKTNSAQRNEGTSLVLTEDDPRAPLLGGLPLIENPFFLEPEGFKGTISEISPNGTSIKITNVHFINNYTGQYEYAETYMVYPNQYTTYVINGDPSQDIHVLQVGEQITAVGNPAYQTQKLTEVTVIYQGSIHKADEVINMPFSGKVQEIDRENGILTIHCFETNKTMHISLREGTPFQKAQINNRGVREYVVIPPNGIPAEISINTICDFVGQVNNSNNDAIADSVVIVSAINE